MKYDSSLLNEEQRLAVEHRLDYPAVCLAGAGSGKTRVITQRLVYLMAEKSVDPKRLLALTFTNKAANEMRERVAAASEDKSPRITTIHSLALSAIRRNPVGFGLSEKVTPIDDYDQKQILKKVIEEKKLEESVKDWLILEKIQFHRARGVGFRADYSAEVHAKAQVDYAGYHAMSDDELSVWSGYETLKTKMSVVDFDDMLHLVVRRGQSDEKWRLSIQKMFHHIIMDESQDTNTCHPAGTLIRKVSGYKKTRGTSVVTQDVAIEDLVTGDKVVAWDRGHGRLCLEGSPISVGSRHYEGDMLSVEVGSKSVDMTPDHRLFATLTEASKDYYAVYLMWKKDTGFRVGQCKLNYSRKKGQGSIGGFAARFMEEKAERGWILKITKSKAESRALEQVISCNYGIPYAQFEPSRELQSTDWLKFIFDSTEGRGICCLLDHSRDFNYPLIEKGRTPTRRYFEIRATNLIPELMALPVETEEGGVTPSPITTVVRKLFSGPVYSMDVANYHTYLSNGIVVKNCQWKFVNLLLGPDNKNLFVVGDISQSIYGFNGASPELISQYTKEWRGMEPVMYKLEKNHRSVPEIVKLANKTQRCMTDVVPLQMKSFRGEQGEAGSIILRKSGTPRELAGKMAEEIWEKNQLAKGRVKYGETAILVRSGSQVRDIETDLVRLRIPYIIRGTMGLMQTEEVRDLLSYMRIISNPKDYFAMLRSIGIPKRGIGDGTLEKIKSIAEESHEGDMIKAAKAYGHAKFSMYLSLLDELTALKDDPISVLEKVIKGTNYLTYLKDRYKKDPDKVEMKVTNIARLKEVIVSLMAGAEITTDDLVFQLTMQDQKDAPDAKDGKVVVSTIHSAKGLEWKTVYVAGVVEGILPHKYSKTDMEVEEERRVAYVAFTRAKDNLILCVPSMLEYFNKGNQFVAPSRFLVELGIMK